MARNTKELQDIFAEVTDGEEEVHVAEQEERGGRFVGGDDRDAVTLIAERAVEDVPLTLPLRYTDLDAIAQQFFSGKSDSEIADDLGQSEDLIIRARYYLGLFHTDDPVDGFEDEYRQAPDDTFAAELEQILVKDKTDKTASEQIYDGLGDAIPEPEMNS